MTADWLNKGGAVVTGAGGGIGRSIALSLAEAGCDVLVADIDLEAAEVVAGEIEALGRRGIAMKVDVTRSDDVKAMADRAYSEFSNVTVLVNNAGVTMRPFRAIWDSSEADFKWMMEVNFFGVQNGVAAFVPRMLETPGRKHIVNTSSMATLIDPAGHGAYNAAKSAVDGLSNSLRNEVEEEDIGVTIVYPGRVDTRISTSERLRPEDDKSENRRVKPYSEYIDARAKRGGKGVQRNPMTGAVASPDAATFAPIDVETTGPMVLEAILANRPYCLTHPVPKHALAKRAERLMDGYHPVNSKASPSSRREPIKDLSAMNLVVARQEEDGVTRFTDLKPKPQIDTPGVSASFFWTNRDIPELPDCGTESGGMTFPLPGGTKFGLVCFPANSAGKAELDSLDQADVSAGKSNPGLHQSNSIDYEVIISGKVDIVLENGDRRTLHQGDCLVMGGVYHAWENVYDEPCVYAAITVGARGDLK